MKKSTKDEMVEVMKDVNICDGCKNQATLTEKRPNGKTTKQCSLKPKKSPKMDKKTGLMVCDGYESKEDVVAECVEYMMEEVANQLKVCESCGKSKNLKGMIACTNVPQIIPKSIVTGKEKLEELCDEYIPKKKIKPSKYQTHVEPYLENIKVMVAKGVKDVEIAKILGINRRSLLRYKQSHEELKIIFDNIEGLTERVEEITEELNNLPTLETLKKKLSDEFFLPQTTVQDKIRIINRLYPDDNPYIQLKKREVAVQEKDSETKRLQVDNEKDNPLLSQRVVIVNDM